VEESFLIHFFRLDEDLNSILNSSGDSEISRFETDSTGSMGMPDLFLMLLCQGYPTYTLYD
jgi:hypothetical protein